MLFSNVNGRMLDDPAYFPLFQKLSDLGVPAFLHPTNPANVDAVAYYRLTAILGFLFDTTIAASRLVFAGVFERLPNLKLVVGHLGGTIPYVAERADRGFEAYEECRAHITRPPGEYFRRMYIDTVSFDPDVLRLGLAFAGPDHVVLGTDFPHQVGNVGRALDAVDALPVTAAQRANIRGGTAARLLGLA
jgi:aminocarboxymuconate-semialdehyde decarboxylase